MTETNDNRTSARHATDDRFVETVLAASDRYPDRTAFVSAHMPGLATVLARNLEERRTTAIVHDDGSEILIEPPDLGRVGLIVMLTIAFMFLRDRGRPRVEAGGEVVELPVGARVRWRASNALAA